MACYRKDGDRNPFWGKKHDDATKARWLESTTRSKFLPGNDARWGPGFEGSGFYWWKKFLLETVGHCERCGFSDVRILELHHRDRDRSHNTRDNLELLCPNCHCLDHYEHKDGQYSRLSDAPVKFA